MGHSVIAVFMKLKAPVSRLYMSPCLYVSVSMSSSSRLCVSVSSSLSLCFRIYVSVPSLCFRIYVIVPVSMCFRIYVIVPVSLCFHIYIIVPVSVFPYLCHRPRLCLSWSQCFPVPYDALMARKELNLHLSTHKGFN